MNSIIRSTTLSLATVFALVAGLLLAFPAMGLPESPAMLAQADANPIQEPVEADEATDLAGFSLRTQAVALNIESDAPFVEDPGGPESKPGGVGVSFTRANLDSGPAGRAQASSLWPGNLIGDSFPTIADNFGWPDAPAYPVQAEARTPGGEDEAELEGPPGTGMYVLSRGLHNEARASMTATGDPSVGLVDSSRSDSRSYVQNDVAVSEGGTVASGLNLLAGVIRVGSVRSYARATNDGENPATTGFFEVQGFTIAEQPIQVTNDGIEVGAEELSGPLNEGLGQLTGAALPSGQELLTELGITVTLLDPEEEIDESTARRNQPGLEIRIDTLLFRTAAHELDLFEVLVEASQGVSALCIPSDDVPPAFRCADALISGVFPLMNSRQELVYTLGGVSAQASVGEEFDFNFDVDVEDFEVDDFPDEPAEDFGGGFEPDSGDTGFADEPFTSEAPMAETEELEEAPAEAAPAEEMAPTSQRRIPEGYAGIPALLFLVGLAGAGLVGRGMVGLNGGVFGGVGARCPLEER